MFTLDHVGVAVADLDAARRAYARLGFALTARGLHQAPGRDGAPVLSGTGNHCMMLRTGYLELIGVTDPAYRGRLRQDLARYQGLHLIALGCQDSEEAMASLRARGVDAAPPRRLNRPIEELGRKSVLAFDIIDMPAGLFAEGHIFAIAHLTRGELWQHHLLSHENGAVALREVSVVSADPAGFAARLQATFAGTPRVCAAAPAEFHARYPGIRPPCLPWIGAMTIAVQDLAAATSLLARHGVRFHERPGAAWVPPEEACGAIVEFVSV